MISRLDRLVDAAVLDLPEQYRTAAQEWARLDGRARELEEGKAHWFAKRCRTMAALSVAAAEREVKAMDEWRDVEKEAAHARTEANNARADMDYLRMKFQQWHVMRASEEMAA